MGNELVLSPLGHTWLIDIDGTIVKHNGYKLDGRDTLLPGAKEFFQRFDHKNDKVVLLTSREERYRKQTESFLKNNGIHFDQIIFDCPYGERILINDRKPSGLSCAQVIEFDRDKPDFPIVRIEENL